MSTDPVLYEPRPPAAVLTLTRPDRRHALRRALPVPDARFGYPEVRRGLVAAMVMPHLLRHVGERLARYLLLTGELIDAEEALRAGFLNAVVPAGELAERALAWARSVAEGGP